MTLIFSVISETHLLQVSDRRASYTNGRSPEDDWNKAVLKDFGAAYGFTGAARVGRLKTHQWIYKILCSVPPVSLGLDELAAEATSELRAGRMSTKVLGIVVVAWVNDSSSPGGDSPRLFTVSNFLRQGLPDKTVDRTSFSVESSGLLPGQPYALHTAGASAGNDVEMQDLHRLLRKAVRKKAMSTLGVEALERRIQEVAKQNKTVGANLMTVCLRRVLPGRPGSEVIDLNRICRFVPAGGKGTSYYTPAIVTPGIKVSDVIVVTPDERPGIRTPMGTALTTVSIADQVNLPDPDPEQP